MPTTPPPPPMPPTDAADAADAADAPMPPMPLDVSLMPPTPTVRTWENVVVGISPTFSFA